MPCIVLEPPEQVMAISEFTHIDGVLGVGTCQSSEYGERGLIRCLCLFVVIHDAVQVGQAFMRPALFGQERPVVALFLHELLIEVHSILEQLLAQQF